MSQIFVETMARAVADYRYLLRRYLSQAERMSKINELNLRAPNLFEDEISVYELGHQIVKDIEKNMDTEERSYYSYSGIAHFCQYLKEFLSHYEMDAGRVIHKAQKASRALINAIQLFMKAGDALTPAVAKDFMQCNQVVADNGSHEQKELYLNNLKRYSDVTPEFYKPILADFEQRYVDRKSPPKPVRVFYRDEEEDSEADRGQVGSAWA